MNSAEVDPWPLQVQAHVKMLALVGIGPRPIGLPYFPKL